MDERLNEIRQLWQENKWLYLFIGFTAGILFFPLLEQFLGGTDFLVELIPEAIGIGFTVLFLDRLNRTFDERRRVSSLKKRLTLEMGSSSNFVAVQAVEQLFAIGALQDGSLKGMDFSRADLRGADMGRANLTDVQFESERYGKAEFDERTRLPDDTFWTPETDMAMFTDPDHPRYWRGFNMSGRSLNRRNYENANLRGADIVKTDLRGANLSGADLRSASLAQSDLRNANCEKAKLRAANLRGANLQDAHLREADLTGAQFDTSTLMPDGLPWTPSTSIQRFTDPHHADFWLPDWAEAPVVT